MVGDYRFLILELNKFLIEQNACLALTFNYTKTKRTSVLLLSMHVYIEQLQRPITYYRFTNK